MLIPGNPRKRAPLRRVVQAAHICQHSIDLDPQELSRILWMMAKTSAFVARE